MRAAGATRVVDGWGDDVPHGTRTDFHRAALTADGETVGFSWIEWPDKATRDAGWQQMMSDDRLTADRPFDGKRMIWGGFSPVVEA